MTRTSSTELHNTPQGFIDSLQEALQVPHLEVTLPHNSQLAGIESTLADACCGLLLGERPAVFVDRKHYVAIIPVPSDRVERVLYKSYILHKPSGARYPCTFHVGEANAAAQKRLTIELEGARFAWLKAQSHIRERLYSYEPLIRVNWQQCTGAEMCKIHLHYSSDSGSLLQELETLQNWIVSEANNVAVRSFPIYVPPRNRFGLSSDPKFREIAYNHGVSLWTRTMKDSPLGNEWCTLATNDLKQMEATLQAYVEFGQTTKWGAKANGSPSSSPSQSPPSPVSPLRSAARTSAAATAAATTVSAAAAVASPMPSPLGRSNAQYTPRSNDRLPPGLNVAEALPATPAALSTPQAAIFPDPVAWSSFGLHIPTDVDYFAAATSPAATNPAAATYASTFSDWNMIFPPFSTSDLLLDPADAHRYISLTDSNSG